MNETCKECGAEGTHDDQCLLVRNGTVKLSEPKRRRVKLGEPKKPVAANPEVEESDGPGEE